mmetsp:Transcript_18107/g.46351  ORF Transcript_18107/g.46351 Transcript_18107/m.46351 type:complete len:248 (+) Transcript_18107:1224-1967(+)
MYPRTPSLLSGSQPCHPWTSRRFDFGQQRDRMRRSTRLDLQFWTWQRRRRTRSPTRSGSAWHLLRLKLLRMAMARRASKVDEWCCAEVPMFPAQHRRHPRSPLRLNLFPKRKWKTNLLRNDHPRRHPHHGSRRRSHRQPRHPPSRRRQLSAHRPQSLRRPRRRPRSRSRRLGTCTRPCRRRRSKRGPLLRASGRLSICWTGGRWRRDGGQLVRRLRVWASCCEAERCPAPISPRLPRFSRRLYATTC